LSTQTKANTSPVFFLTALPGGARQQSHSVCLSLLRALLQERQIPIRPPDQKARLSAALWPQEIHLPGGRERILSPGDDTHRESGGNAANTIAAGECLVRGRFETGHWHMLRDRGSHKHRIRAHHRIE